MRLKRILLSLTAFVLALSSALPAGAEAFTIPTGSTTSCKKNEAPVNAWWPNGGNSSNEVKIKAVDMAVDQYGYVWVITKWRPAESFQLHHSNHRWNNIRA